MSETITEPTITEPTDVAPVVAPDAPVIFEHAEPDAIIVPDMTRGVLVTTWADGTVEEAPLPPPLAVDATPTIDDALAAVQSATTVAGLRAAVLKLGEALS